MRILLFFVGSEVYMLRQKRVDVARMIYHAINRGNARNTIFHKPEDYDAFLRVLAEGLEKYQVDLFSFVLMPNHWHLVLRPGQDGEMGKLLRWITSTHSLRYHAHFDTRGYGYIYQSRFNWAVREFCRSALGVGRPSDRSRADLGLERGICCEPDPSRFFR